MTRTERDELDSKVMAAIRGGAKRAATIHESVGLAYHIREIDRSRQRLRKAGRIQYDAGKGWEEVAR